MRMREWVCVSVGLRGHGFNIASTRVQNWAVTEVLPPKTGRCRGVASRRTGFALGGTAVLREMRSFGMISNEADINPPTSGNFIWIFVLSSVCSSTTFPSPSLLSQMVWEGSSRGRYVESIKRGLWRLLLL